MKDEGEGEQLRGRELRNARKTGETSKWGMKDVERGKEHKGRE